MILFRKNVLFLPLQISTFDYGFKKVVPFLSSLLSLKIAKFHRYDYENGDFYFNPKEFEKVNIALSSKIEIVFLKDLKALYQKTEKKLLDNVRKPPGTIDALCLKTLFDDYLEFAKYPLLSKLLPELISVKIQRDNSSLSLQTFLELVRPKTTITRRFCENSLALCIALAHDEKIFKLFMQENYQEAIRAMEQNLQVKKTFNKFVNDFYAFGPRRWDVEGCEAPIVALKMVHESCKNLDKKTLIKRLNQLRKERITHYRFLQKQIKRQGLRQNEFLEYLWFFQSALDSETPIQRQAFFKCLLPALVNKGKYYKKKRLIEREEDILFMYIDELFNQRFSVAELAKRKRIYFSLLKKLNDPGDINFFKSIK